MVSETLVDFVELDTLVDFDPWIVVTLLCFAWTSDRRFAAWFSVVVIFLFLVRTLESLENASFSICNTALKSTIARCLKGGLDSTAAEGESPSTVATLVAVTFFPKGPLRTFAAVSVVISLSRVSLVAVVVMVVVVGILVLFGNVSVLSGGG